MSQAATRKHWTFDEYLAWETSQPGRYELVDGEVRAMTGGTSAHDLICNNLRAELRAALRGGPCRAHGPELKLRAGDNVRYPDALIDCGARVSEALFTQRPVAVFEVLSRSTAWIDQTVKLRDYKSVPHIRHYALISQDECRVLVYDRDELGRLSAHETRFLEGLSASITLTDPALTIPLALLYEGLDFPA